MEIRMKERTMENTASDVLPINFFFDIKYTPFINDMAIVIG